MTKPGQTVGQKWDDEEAAVPRFSTPVRGPDERVVLVNERLAVWDRRKIEPPHEPPLDAIQDPVWDHKGGRVWTPDLVHCRLLNVGDTIARLPSPLRRGYFSVLGDVALGEKDREVKRPPTAAEISIADWTWTQLLKRPALKRSLLQAMAFGASVRTVAAMLSKAHGKEIKKSSVANWYLSERRSLAVAWIKAKQLVDSAAYDRWRSLFEDVEK